MGRELNLVVCRTFLNNEVVCVLGLVVGPYASHLFETLTDAAAS